MRHLSRTLLGVACLAAPLFAGAAPPSDSEAEMARIQQRVLVQGKPCPDPQRPCDLPGNRFQPNELSFEAPRKFEFDRGEDRSQAFYAIVLASGPACGIADPERLRAQELFPRNKVFLHRYFCEDFSDKVTYTNVDRKRAFLAVYAGETEAAARTFLDQVKASGRFPGANIRRMQVVIKWQLE